MIRQTKWHGVHTGGMKRRARFGLCIGGAVLLHAAGVLGVGVLARQPSPLVLPLFRSGLTGIEFVLLEDTPSVPTSETEAPSQRESPSAAVEQAVAEADAVVAPPGVDPLLEQGSAAADRAVPMPVAAPPVVPEPDGRAREVADVVGKEDPAHPFVRQGVDRVSGLEAVITPRYPMVSRRRGEEGDVTVRAVVGQGGRTVETTIVRSSGYAALDRSAVEAMVKACYMTAAGARIDSGEVELTFQFRLKDRG